MLSPVLHAFSTLAWPLHWSQVTDRGGLTTLHWAAKEGHAAVVQALLEARASVEAADEDGMTPLQLAAIFNRLPVARCLVSAGAEAAKALPLAKRFERCKEPGGPQS